MIGMAGTYMGQILVLWHRGRLVFLIKGCAGVFTCGTMRVWRSEGGVGDGDGRGRWESSYGLERFLLDWKKVCGSRAARLE